jgi:trk system potassium uptake protein TrkA
MARVALSRSEDGVETFLRRPLPSPRVSIVIAGAGEVGYYIAKSLYSEGYEVAIIESSEKAANRAENLDALVVRGNAAAAKYLEEAGIREAENFIAVTRSDEINMVACSIAKSYGVRTIARINHTDYIDRPVSLDKFKLLGIDVAICPDLVAAHKIVRILTSPPALLETNVFAKGKIKVVQVMPGEDAPVMGAAIRDVYWPKGANLAAIFRKSDVIVPRGSDVIQPGDRVLVVGNDSAIKDTKELLGIRGKLGDDADIQKVMIAGATRIGINIAKLLERDVDVTLIEPEPLLAEEASELLSSTLVIQGEPTDRELLMDEGVTSVDSFIGATAAQGKNILSCFLAEKLGAHSTIALIDQLELVDLLYDVGIDLATSPRISTVNTILQYVHQSEDLVSLAVMQQGEARVLEMVVHAKAKVVGKSLRKIGMPTNSIVAAIVREGATIIPHGETVIEVGDTAVVFARTESIPKLKKLF